MRILHVLWGYAPWREGGLVLYAEELMQAQQEAGHQVAAFFAGRRSLWGKPRLTTWDRNGVTLFEMQNAPLVHRGKDGTFPAAAELAEPISEAFFSEVVAGFRPEVVHVHELAGLPFTLLDSCRASSLPLVLTLHDYFALCPTLNLFNRHGEVCRDATGHNCADCCAQSSDGGLFDRVRTVRSEGKSLLLFAPALLLRLALDWLVIPNPPREQLVLVYRRRLQENLTRLRQADVVISQSGRTREIYRERTGREDIRMMHSSLSHIEKMSARRRDRVDAPVRFATLNGAIAPYKGSLLLDRCVQILKERGYEGCYQLDIFGRIEAGVKRSLLSSPSVRWRGRYLVAELDALLDKVDVGIIPSLCEEVYGYVGIEFLAKGIPIIGNERGGITDYTLDGRTGWVNRSCSAEELADIMETIIKNPRLIIPLNQWISANRDALVADRKQHFSQIIDCYRQAIVMHEVR